MTTPTQPHLDQPKKKSGCMKIGLIAIAVLVGIIILVAILVTVIGSGEEDDTNSNAAPAPTETAAPATEGQITFVRDVYVPDDAVLDEDAPSRNDKDHLVETYRIPDTDVDTVVSELRELNDADSDLGDSGKQWCGLSGPEGDGYRMVWAELMTLADARPVDMVEVVAEPDGDGTVVYVSVGQGMGCVPAEN